MDCSRHEDIERRFGDIEARMDAAEAKIGLLEGANIRGEEQIKTVFRILGEIKELLQTYTERMEKRIDRLAEDIERVKMKPARMFDGFVMAAISAAAGAFIMWLMK